MVLSGTDHFYARPITVNVPESLFNKTSSLIGYARRTRRCNNAVRKRSLTVITFGDVNSVNAENDRKASQNEYFVKF